MQKYIFYFTPDVENPSVILAELKEFTCDQAAEEFCSQNKNEGCISWDIPEDFELELLEEENESL